MAARSAQIWQWLCMGLAVPVLLAAVCAAAQAAAAAEAVAGAGVGASGQPAVRALAVRPGLYMLTVAGENAALQTGPDGVLIVDTGPASGSAALLAAIRKITAKPIRYIINTSASADRVGGNERVAEAGDAFTGVLGTDAPIIAQQNVLLTMTHTPRGGTAIYHTEAALPSLTYGGRQKNLYLNGEGIEVIAAPAAHSDGDSVVLFRGSDVLVAGDLIDMTRFPVIDTAHGGTIQGEIDALNRLLDAAIPLSPVIWQSGGTIVIPGRGRLGEQEEIVQYRDMVTIMRDRIRDLIDHGRTLAQIQAADPTDGYDVRYGADSGDWTTRQFVEAVYESLMAARNKR
ncbi:MAG TPA: MBL fold metallo-hydrolase [Steroidobacteraceae bacterium]|jgi:glyoxylase-like metal-dependent hydrolase (beta-lactamase superfamily II)|nr:MBL fold metallo-hydrolase [Steroidobacteraceae bacterium]